MGKPDVITWLFFCQEIILLCFRDLCFEHALSTNILCTFTLIFLFIFSRMVVFDKIGTYALSPPLQEVCAIDRNLKEKAQYFSKMISECLHWYFIVSLEILLCIFLELMTDKKFVIGSRIFLIFFISLAIELSTSSHCSEMMVVGKRIDL